MVCCECGRALKYEHRLSDKEGAPERPVGSAENGVRCIARQLMSVYTVVNIIVLSYMFAPLTLVTLVPHRRSVHYLKNK